MTKAIVGDFPLLVGQESGDQDRTALKGIWEHQDPAGPRPANIRRLGAWGKSPTTYGCIAIFSAFQEAERSLIRGLNPPFPWGWDSGRRQEPEGFPPNSLTGRQIRGAHKGWDCLRFPSITLGITLESTVTVWPTLQKQARDPSTENRGVRDKENKIIYQTWGANTILGFNTPNLFQLKTETNQKCRLLPYYLTSGG